MKLLRRYTTLMIGGFLIGLLPLAPKLSSNVYGQNTQLPQEYIPNYQIAKERNEILNMFVQIQAVKNTGLDLDEDFFKKLATNFEKVFPRLPQESKFKVTYEQCRILTNNLSQEYTFNKFGQFLDSCFSALDRDIKDMNAKYSVQAKMKTNPQLGSAPLSVTFDARDSYDPSNETLPSNNYYRYYKDTNGIDQVIGKGAVVNHTFSKEGNYIVHLTVRSANQSVKGTLDGSASTTISVGPEAANIVVFANGQRLREDNIAKIGTAEAQEGVFLDASATVPKGGRIIQSHTWEVKGGNNTLLKETNNGKPDAIQVKFPDEGQFSVALSTTDNENNTVKKVFSIVIADPLALIRSNPENGNTSTTFSFDASSSYSLISKLRLYTREIFDPSGERIDTIQGKQISKRFSQPGNYAIKLTVEDEQGRKNTETKQLFVESTEPIPQFAINPLQDRSSPSQFELDAGLSNDVDILGANDFLDYQRDFSPLEYVKVDEIIDNGRKLIVTFNQKGNYDIKLTVSDQFGKLSEITKKLEVKSSLRPEMYISPVAGFWGNNVKFLVRANKPVVNYERDLGDGTKRSILENKLIYSYDKVGVYPVTLTVYGPDDEKNSITRNVYIGETGKPIVAYTVKSRSNIILKQEDSCFDGAVEIPAYRVPRLQSLLIDVAESVNTKGERANLQYYFQPQNDNIYKSNNFNYKFAELGCQRVDITIEDTQVHATHTQKVWFRVVNDLPVLQNIQMTFPQFGNQVGVGLSQGQEKQVFDGSTIDPLIVHVIAANARDPDGAIAFFKWYYFNKDNPDRILETKITPANVPEAYFSLQKIPGEYEFGVTLVDNDGGEQKSRSLIGNGPVVFFPPDSTNIDIPIVTLRQSEVNARIGDEITFEAVAKILSDRSDFEATRSIKYDFDGDGEADLTTKDSKVTYYYRQAGQYTPRVKVVYRGIPGSAVGEKIVVEDGIKPIILLENLGPLVIARDVSLGTNVHTVLCMDTKKCGSDKVEAERDAQYMQVLSGEDKVFSFIYPGTGEYDYEMSVVDDFANQAVKTGVLVIDDAANDLEDIALLSIPKAQVLNGGYSVTVGSNLDNTIVYYIANPLQGECFVDTDITIDSDGDGDAEQDRNLDCDTLVSEKYEPLFDSQAGRIYYQKDGTLERVDLTITFLDKTLELDEKLVPIYKDISSLILSLDASDSDIQYLKDLLLGLRNQLGDRVGIAAQVISIRDHVKNIENKLTEQEINRLDVILYALSDSTVTAALGGTPYEQAKQDILLLVPIEVKQQLVPLFLTIDNADGNKDLIKETLQSIIDIVKNNAGDQEGQIDPLDLDLIVLPKICQILNYYEISSKACDNQDGDTSNADTQNTGENTTSGGSVWGKVFKVILIIVVVLGVVFGTLVAIFAIKAKLAQKSEENSSDSSGGESNPG